MVKRESSCLIIRSFIGLDKLAVWKYRIFL